MKRRNPIPLVPLLLILSTALIAQEDDTRQTEPQDPAQAGRQDAPEPGETSRERPNIYPTLAAQLIENDDFEVPVIDVRSAEEVEETGVAAGATHIPHTDIDALAEFIGDKNRTVVLYCGSGRRAGLAIDSLRERGFHGLINAGGREDLQAALDDEG